MASPLSMIASAFTPTAGLKAALAPGTPAGDSVLGKAISQGVTGIPGIDILGKAVGQTPAGTEPPVRGSFPVPPSVGSSPMGPPPSATGGPGPWTGGLGNFTGFMTAGRKTLLGG